ncbi:MAG: acyl-CoA dehydrogenase family protein [Deltaproteobacteria bacterium]|nr:acyl-CoA dehydrogenase family protein [Deltaproteobacteria bacterium]
MRFSPGADHALVEKTARAFARDVLAPRAAMRDRTHAFPHEELRQLGALGLIGITVPPEHGGAGMDSLAQAYAIAAIAEADVSVAVTLAVTNMVAEVLSRHAMPACRERYVPRLCAGELGAAAFALSEAGAGSDPAGLRTRCEATATGYLLNGTKQWITSGDVAGVFVIMARHVEADPSGRPRFSAFAVPAGTPGLVAGAPENKLGQRGSSTVPLTLDDVVVPAEALLGSEGGGFRLAMQALDGGRINVGAMSVGVSRAAVNASLAYAKERRQFGQRLADFQGISFMLADAATKVDAAWLMVARAAWQKDRGQPASKAAAQAKLFASESAQQICDSALQIHGGYGYTREFPVERFVRDARVMTIYEGTSQIQKLVVAREVIKELGHEQR